MTWEVFLGDGKKHKFIEPKAPPWRHLDGTGGKKQVAPPFKPTKDLIQAINAAIYLRRPLLVTGSPGSGKSSIADAIANELQLGAVLRWHITSRSTLEDGMYRYDALGRLHQSQLKEGTDEITQFLRLGPLGTALVAEARPRVLLIDELDKSDLDLPSDLLHVLERGEYEIPELSRHKETQVQVRSSDSDDPHTIAAGRIVCRHFPIIVMTSNREREFPPPFLRRCVRTRLDIPRDVNQLAEIVAAHFDLATLEAGQVDLVRDFVDRLRDSPGGHASLAVDQLLSVVFLLNQEGVPDGADRAALINLIERSLNEP